MKTPKAARLPISCLLVTLFLWAGACLTGRAAAAEAGKVRVLLITGGHDFEREPFFKVFQENPDLTFEAVEHPQAQARWKTGAAGQYDVIVLYDMWQPISDETKADFLARLKDGKGLVALHHCLASYQNWPEYAQIIGGKYRLEQTVVNGVEKPGSTYLHDVDFTVRIADLRHPVTRGLKDFAIHDETYGGFDVSPQSHVLLTTDTPTSGPAIGWAKTYGKARVVYLQLGHDHLAYENPNYRRLVAQAIRWVARR